ncbi:hypothetical protein AX15_004474 [Amanita polypyramis BW_CC]|nr:hypothetical protein AX15_004474 [Amanita polypyramis BW_CC]
MVGLVARLGVLMASVRIRLSLVFAVAIVLGTWSYQRRASSTYIVCSNSQNIYTVSDLIPNVACVSVHNTHIIAIGTLDDVLNQHPDTVPFFTVHPWITSLLNRLLRPGIKYIPDNAIIVPGLADAHAHVIENGYMKQLPLTDANSVQDVITLVKKYIEAHPDIRDDRSRWVEGMGWDQMKWPGKAFPTASDLDEDPLLKGRPIMLVRIDGHARLVSPAILEVMGDLPDHVEGGEIIRDSDGKPTGLFVDNAMSLVPAPTWTDEQMSGYFETTMNEALSSGLTSIHDAASQPHHIEFLKRKAEEGTLPIRLYLMGYSEKDEYWGDKLSRLINYGKHGRLNLQSVKLFSDGALGSWGAALLQPYSDRPETEGLMLASSERLSKLVHRFYEDGWQVNVHCIGDRANHIILDIFEDILEGKGGTPRANVSEWRPRIEHAQIISPDDLQRIGRLGVIPSVQPTHATSDMWYAESRLGPERIKGAYAYQTLLRSSANKVIALGSDFPVEGVNPLLGFYAAVSRLSVDGISPHGPTGWYSEERLTRAQALKGMTLDAAYASFAEHELGSLIPGKKADFVVLDRNIVEIPMQEILRTKVIATVVDGEVMYGRL